MKLPPTLLLSSESTLFNLVIFSLYSFYILFTYFLKFHFLRIGFYINAHLCQKTEVDEADEVSSHFILH